MTDKVYYNTLEFRVQSTNGRTYSIFYLFKSIASSYLLQIQISSRVYASTYLIAKQKSDFRFSSFWYFYPCVSERIILTNCLLE